jgi:hypothetical protein
MIISRTGNTLNRGMGTWRPSARPTRNASALRLRVRSPGAGLLRRPTAVEK